MFKSFCIYVHKQRLWRRCRRRRWRWRQHVSLDCVLVCVLQNKFKRNLCRAFFMQNLNGEFNWVVHHSTHISAYQRLLSPASPIPILMCAHEKALLTTSAEIAAQRKVSPIVTGYAAAAQKWARSRWRIHYFTSAFYLCWIIEITRNWNDLQWMEMPWREKLLWFAFQSKSIPIGWRLTLLHWHILSDAHTHTQQTQQTTQCVGAILVILQFLQFYPRHVCVSCMVNDVHRRPT